MNKKSIFLLLLSFSLIPLSLRAAVQFWDPDGAVPGTSVSGNWDTVTANWTATTDSGVNTVWTQGNDASFGVTADYTVSLTQPITVGNLTLTGGAGTLTISGDPVNNLALAGTSTLDTGGRSVTISAPITGNFGLIRTNGGTLTLSGASTYSGGTVLNTGTTTIAVDSVSSGGVITSGPFGTGPVTFSTSSQTITASGGPRVLENPITLSVNLSINGSSALTLTNGDFKIAGATRTITVNNSADTVFAGNLTDDGSPHQLTKNGTGRLIVFLGNSTSFLGTNVVSGGTLVAGNRLPLPTNNNAPLLVNNGGTLDLNGFDIIMSRLGSSGNNFTGSVLLGTNTLTVGNNASSSEFQGIISGSGGYVKVGSVSQVLSGSNTFTGGITITAGSLYFPTNAIAGNPIALGPGGNTITITGTGRIGASRAAPSISIVTNNVVLNTLTAGLDPASGGQFFLSGNVSGPGGFVRTTQGSGFPVLAASNTFTGGVQIDARIFGLGDKNALGTGPLTIGNPTTPPGNTIELASTLDLVGSNAITNVTTINQSFTFNGTLTGFGLELSGPVTLSDGVKTNKVIGTGLAKISGVISGTGGINKDGTNTLVLSANNTYSGSTLVTTGILALVNSGSVAGSSNISVFAGATLDVTGRTDGTLTIGTTQKLNGDGVFNVAGNLTNRGIIELKANKVNPTITNDSIQGLNKISYGGTLSLVLSGDPLAASDSLKLFYATTYAGSFANISPTTPGNGLAWDTSTLNSDGTLRIVSVAAPSFATTTLSGTNLVLTGSGGSPGGTYSVVSSTDITTPLLSWSVVQTGSFDGSGNFTVTNGVTLSDSKRFFVLRTP
ncbi:MAG: autotransporter-associated beta strand repeat-containing protein [Verrucomicrobiota bacterium]